MPGCVLTTVNTLLLAWSFCFFRCAIAWRRSGFLGKLGRLFVMLHPRLLRGPHWSCWSRHRSRYCTSSRRRRRRSRRNHRGVFVHWLRHNFRLFGSRPADRSYGRKRSEWLELHAQQQFAFGKVTFCDNFVVQCEPPAIQRQYLVEAAVMRMRNRKKVHTVRQSCPERKRQELH